jgi:hypothetical protein
MRSIDEWMPGVGYVFLLLEREASFFSFRGSKTKPQERKEQQRTIVSYSEATVGYHNNYISHMRNVAKVFHIEKEWKAVKLTVGPNKL